MFAFPRTGLGADVQRARAALPVLPRGFAGHRFSSPASTIRVPATRERGRRSPGFTLLEMLIVVAIIGLLLVLIAPAFTTIKGGTDVTSAAIHDQRRARHRAHIREGEQHLHLGRFL